MTFSAPIISPIAPSPTGYAIEPVATIVPCPTISLGTDAIVPMPPGLVSVMFAPCRSSAVSVFVRAFSTSASYAATNSSNASPARVGDHRHHQRSGAVLLLHVHRQPEIHLAVLHPVWPAVDLGVVVGHHGRVLAPRARSPTRSGAYRTPSCPPPSARGGARPAPSPSACGSSSPSGSTATAPCTSPARRSRPSAVRRPPAARRALPPSRCRSPRRSPPRRARRT